MIAPRSLRAAFLVALAGLAALPAPARAQGKAVPISQAQNDQAPYLYTGRLSVTHGNDEYFGSATLIRRYTVLTCGHLLYNGETGFSTNLLFDPHFYLRANGFVSSVASFEVLSGYQPAARSNGDSDGAFARDLGYALLINPAPNDAWADWQAAPDNLLKAGARLVLGYAAETYPGTVMSSVTSSQPYELLQDGLYESTDYYTQSGMSGGPVYLFVDGKWQVFAETVAGTSPPEIAISDVRGITEEARPFLIEPEYAKGMVKGAFVTGSTTVPLGSTSVGYKTGVIFVDGKREGTQLPARYDELKLVAGGPNKASVVITKKKTGKFKVNFGGLAKGQAVELRLLRDTLSNKSQTPLARLTVTVQ